MYNPQIETFIHVADAGSFNKAAEELYITPTAVIKQINLLEAELDLELFIRSYRGLRLTPAGESLYQDAKDMIQSSKEAIQRARNAKQKKGHIVVTSSIAGTKSVPGNAVYSGTNIRTTTIYPGAVKTELLNARHSAF